jgi:hypothetical protein
MGIPSLQPAGAQSMDDDALCRALALLSQRHHNSPSDAVVLDRKIAADLPDFFKQNVFGLPSTL